MEQTENRENGFHADEEKAREEHENDPLADLYRYLRELQDYATYYLAVRRDQLLAALRSVALTIVLVSLLALMGTFLLLAAALSTLRGLAGAIAAALDGNVWLGELLAGGGLLLLVLLGALLAKALVKRKWYKSTRKEYERRLRVLNGYATSFTTNGRPQRQFSPNGKDRSEEEKVAELQRAEH